jgi:hypothetical protein
MGRARLARRTAELSGPSLRAQVSSRSKAVLPRDAFALAALFVLTCVMTNPLVLHIAGAVEDKQDALLNTWIVSWVGHALVTDPSSLFNANIFYPYPNTLAFSETMLPQGLFALPFNLVFGNTVLGYNLVLLASFFLAGYGMYLLVFDLTRSRGPALVAGTIFAFNPFNLGNLAQVQLLSFGWLPLALVYLRRMLRTANTTYRILKGKQKILSLLAPRSCILFALFFSLQALSSFYFALLAGFAVVLYIAWQLALSPNYQRTTALIRVLFSFVIIAILVVPFFLPYLSVQRDLGFQRNIEESEPFSASLKLYASVSPQNAVYGSLLAPRPPIVIGGYPLDNLFPGVIALLLAAVGIATAKRREGWFYLLLLVFAFVLSLGPRLFLAPSVATDVTLPYRWLYDVVPLLRAFRAPVRFDALVMFALAALAGFGAHVAERSRQKAEGVYRILPTACSLLLTGAIALEYFALPAANIAPVPTGDAIPQYIRWLAQQPAGVAVELPLIASDPTQPLDLTTQYLSTYHWHPTPDGYSGFVPPLRGEIAYEMQSFPGERATSLLQALDVRFVVLHADKFANWSSLRAAIVQVDDLQLAQQFGSDYIYRVAPRLQDPGALGASVYLPNPAAPNQNYFAYVIVRNRGPRSFAIKPTDALQVDAHWSDGTIERVRSTLPLVTTSASVVQVQLSTPPRAGAYRLELNISGSGIEKWDLSGDVSLQNVEPSHQIVLPARVGLSAPLKPVYGPGETVQVNLTWLPLNKIDAYYSASVRVVDALGNKISSDADREPALRTLLWTPGVAVPDMFAVPLPRDLSPGAYSVQLLMYQADQGVDALLLDDQYGPRETATLGTFTVKQ